MKPWTVLTRFFRCANQGNTPSCQASRTSSQTQGSCHARFKGLEPDSHKRLSEVLEEEIPAEFRSEIVVVSGPSHAEETIVRDLTLISAASKTWKQPATSKIFSATTTSDFTQIMMLSA